MAINKVVLNTDAGEQTLVDLTGDTVTPETLAEGATAHSADGEAIVGTMKASAPVQPDWNQTDETAADFIKNKPFGEVPDSDTLTWDGNTDGLYSFERYGATLYKVSDVIVTLEDLANGANVAWSDSNGVQKVDQYVFDRNGNYSLGPIVNYDGVFSFLVANPENGDAWDGIMCYPEGKEHPAGVYIAKIEKNGYTLTIDSFNIPDFGKFIVTKTIDTKYLPEGVVYAETKGSNTISIAANPVGFQTCSDWSFYKVSNAIVTEADIKDGAVITYGSFDDSEPARHFVQCTRNLWYETYNGIIGIYGADHYGNAYAIIECRTDGVYFYKDTGWLGVYAISLTLPEYGKFQKVKPLDTKYLPEALRFGEVSGANAWNYEGSPIEKATDIIDGCFFKISDAVVPPEAILDPNRAFYLKFNYWDRIEYESWAYADGSNDVWVIRQLEDGVIVIPFVDENGNAFDAAYCYPEGLDHEPGIYAYYDPYQDENGNESFYGLTHIDLQGIADLTTSVKIDPKYLPDNIGGGVTEERVNELINEALGVIENGTY